MRALQPARMHIRVALLAVVIHHQRRGRNQIAVLRPRQRWLEVLFAFLRRLGIPVSRILRLHVDHQQRQRSDRHGITDPDPPLDPPSGEAVQPVQPDHCQRAEHVQPVDDGSRQRCLQFKEPHDANQQQARDQHHSGNARTAHIPAARRADSADAVPPAGARAKHQERQNQQQPQRDVQQEHDQVETVLIGQPGAPAPAHPFHAGHGRQIDRVRSKHGRERHHQMKEDLQPGTQARGDALSAGSRPIPCLETHSSRPPSICSSTSRGDRGRIRPRERFRSQLLPVSSSPPMSACRPFLTRWRAVRRAVPRTGHPVGPSALRLT